MSQQTQIERAKEYYHHWMQSFPTVHALASAESAFVLKHWEGLGYYSRCKNIHKSAKIIIDQYEGIIPDNYQEIIKLPGIGRYTAGAILSIAYNKPLSAIDGNLKRVLSRLFDWQKEINLEVSEQFFEKQNQALLKHAQPRMLNQALMELGALICKPQKTLCNLCPIASHCLAHKNKTIERCPHKKKSTKIIKITMRHYLIEYNDKIIMHQDKKWWHNLYSFPFIIDDVIDDTQKSLFSFIKEQSIKNDYFAQINHKVTHYNITSFGYSIKLKKPHQFVGDYDWISHKDIQQMSLSKPARYLFNQLDQG